MTDLPLGFVLCWTVFCCQAFLAHYITARCITGAYPVRDIQLLPVVMLAIAGAVTFGLSAALELAPEARMHTEFALYVSCLGELGGIVSASIRHRRTLIELAAQEREDRAADSVPPLRHA